MHGLRDMQMLIKLSQEQKQVITIMVTAAEYLDPSNLDGTKIRNKNIANLGCDLLMKKCCF